MNNFKSGGFKKRDTSYGDRPKFGGDRGNKNRSGGRSIETFKAECSKCHKSCTLPFKPNGVKPVFCSDCFEKKDSGDSYGSNRNDRNDRNDRREYPKPPRDERPPRHEPRAAQPNLELEEVKRKLETIEARLNRILDIINPPTAPAKKGVAAEVTSAPVTKTVAKKVVKKVAKKVAKKATVKTAKKVAKKTTKGKK